MLQDVFRIIFKILPILICAVLGFWLGSFMAKYTGYKWLPWVWAVLMCLFVPAIGKTLKEIFYWYEE